MGGPGGAIGNDAMSKGSSESVCLSGTGWEEVNLTGRVPASHSCAVFLSLYRWPAWSASSRRSHFGFIFSTSSCMTLTNSSENSFLAAFFIASGSLEITSSSNSCWTRSSTSPTLTFVRQ